jgi:hypothetical protein
MVPKSLSKTKLIKEKYIGINGYSMRPFRTWGEGRLAGSLALALDLPRDFSPISPIFMQRYFSA